MVALPGRHKYVIMALGFKFVQFLKTFKTQQVSLSPTHLPASRMGRYRFPSLTPELSFSQAQKETAGDVTGLETNQQHQSRPSVHQNVRSSKTRAKSRRVDDRLKRHRSGVDYRKQKDIEMAKKKELLRYVHSRLNPVLPNQQKHNRIRNKANEFCFVFVGNVCASPAGFTAVESIRISRLSPPSMRPPYIAPLPTVVQYFGFRFVVAAVVQ
jgi:hypothetical protein